MSVDREREITRRLRLGRRDEGPRGASYGRETLIRIHLKNGYHLLRRVIAQIGRACARFRAHRQNPGTLERDREIEARGWELIGLVSTELPHESEVTGEINAGPMVAAALASRVTGTMRSILRLLPDGAEADAGTLLRSLYDHAVNLAWLAADPSPERIRRWRKDDLEKRLKVDGDMRDHDEPLLSPQEREVIEAQVAQITEPSLPPLTVLAEQADEHWEGRLPGMGARGEIKSFRGFYPLVFRRNSFFAHASLMGLNPVIEDLSLNRKRVRLEGHCEGNGPYGMATLIFGFALYVLADYLGWPKRSQINAVFERHPADN